MRLVNLELHCCTTPNHVHRARHPLALDKNSQHASARATAQPFALEKHHTSVVSIGTTADMMSDSVSMRGSCLLKIWWNTQRCIRMAANRGLPFLSVDSREVMRWSVTRTRRNLRDCQVPCELRVLRSYTRARVFTRSCFSFYEYNQEPISPLLSLTICIIS